MRYGVRVEIVVGGILEFRFLWFDIAMFHNIDMKKTVYICLLCTLPYVRCFDRYK